MTTPCVQLRKVSKDFRSANARQQVLQQIELSVFQSDRLVIYGPSGCGKTTLLHLLAFLDLPSSGTYLFRGEATHEWTEKQRCSKRAQDIGLVFQNFHVLPSHSVLDNLLLRLRYLPSDVDALDPLRLLSQVGLDRDAKKPAKVLSGGEKQRLCIARAMLFQPKLFLADEPTGNLDPENSQAVLRLFQEVSSQGAAMVIATHDPKWFDFATRIIRLEAGRLKEET